MVSKLQNLFILLGLIAVGGVGYYLYTQNGDISLNNSKIDNQVAAETSDFLHRLNELKVIKLDGAILNDTRFTSLVDSSSIVAPSPVGREDPFIETN